MTRCIATILALLLCLSFTACTAKEEEAPAYVPPTQEEIAACLNEQLKPQIAAYSEAFGVEDIDVQVDIREFEVTEYDYHDIRFVSCKVHHLITWPSMTDHINNRTATEEMLRQVYAISFEFEDFEFNGYEIHVYGGITGSLVDSKGAKYTVTPKMVLKDDVIAFVTPDVQLPAGVGIGTNINSYVGSLPSGNDCPNCNGSGYVKFYYGDGSQQYNVGHCPLCS